MRGKSIALLMLALGCGLVAAIGITQVLAKRNAEPADARVSMQSVLVAARDISMGHVIDPDDVKVESWPQDKVPLGTLSKVEEATGRRTRGLIVAGEPILDKKLRISDIGVSQAIPKGFRVVSVKVDSVSSSSGLIMPGDRVDVLVSLTRNTSQGIFETKTLTILQDIRVFAVNDDVELDNDKNGKERTFEARTISLLVTPKQAAKVTLATELGRIRLVMRPPDDDVRADNTSAKPSELLGPSLAADRKKEGTRSVPGMSGLLGYFNPENLQGRKKEEPPSPKPPNTWIIRLLQPDSVDEIVLKEDPTAKSLGGGTWRISETSSVISTDESESKNRSSKPKPAAVSLPPLPPASSAEPKAAEAANPKGSHPLDVLTEPQPAPSEPGDGNSGKEKNQKTTKI